MLSRLRQSIRYLMTGTLEKAAKDTIVPANDSAPSVLVMRDYYEVNGIKTAIEVRSDGIHCQTETQDETVIPLDAAADELESIDPDIRLQIARKLSLLLPELSEGKQKQLQKYIFNVLELLAQDQLMRVRRLIAEELRESFNAPVELIRRLAWDDKLEVAAPILEFSPLLTDHDLMELIANSDVPGTLEVLSRRKDISEDITDAIVHTITRRRYNEDDVKAISNLLGNQTAKFRENTLEILVEEAPQYESWHGPLISRPELTVRMVNKIARFVSEALIMEMQERHLISEELGKNLKLAVASRLQNPHIDREKEADRQAIELFTQGVLDGEHIIAALETGEREFAVSALSLLADVPKTVTKAILKSGQPDAVTALSWKAGISMRSAIQVQLKLAQIHHTKILYAKDGSSYPLSEGKMQQVLKDYL